MHMIKAIIFDLDGTLLDTLADIVISANTVLVEHGFEPHDYDNYKNFIGNGAHVLIQKATGSEDPDIVDEVLADYLTYYNEHSTDKTTPYEGVMEVLKACQEKSIPISIVSNKPHASTVKAVKHYFSDVEFFAIEGQSEGVPTKPDPTKVLRILNDLKVLPEEALFIGDSNVDMMTGQNAKVPTIGCCYGFRGRRELEEAKADMLVESPIEILNYL